MNEEILCLIHALIRAEIERSIVKQNEGMDSVSFRSWDDYTENLFKTLIDTATDDEQKTLSNT